MTRKLRYLCTLLLLLVVSMGYAGTIVFSELGLKDGTQYTTPFNGGDFSVTFGGGQNDGKYYNSGSAIRVYGGGTMTIAAGSGKITGITLTFDGTNKPSSGDVVNVGTYSPDKNSWTGEAESVIFTRPTGSGHWRVQKIEVTVSGGVIKEDAGLSFGSTTEFTVEPNASFTAPTLTNPHSLTVTYASSDDEVASVNATTGAVTIGAKEGTATITASSEETSAYLAGEATYTITVKDNSINKIIFGNNGTKINAASVTGKDSKGITWTITSTGTSSFTQSTNYSQVGSSSYPAETITFTATLPSEVEIKSFSAKFGGNKSSAGTITLKVGDEVVGTGSLDETNDVTVSSTKSANGNVLTITVTEIDRAVKCYEISYSFSGDIHIKAPAGLAYSETSFTVEPNATFTAPTLANPNNLTVTYSSSDDEIASVNETTGAVTIGSKEGTATITASSAATDDYEAGEATYTITVEAPHVLANLAALSAQTDNGSYDVALTNAVVTYVNGNYAYIQDASGAIVMYKSGHGLTAGKVLNGTATVTYQVRNGNPQITNITGYTATDGTAPEPTEVAASAWNTSIATVLSQYFKVTGATITKESGKYYVELGDEKVQLYGQGEANPITVKSLDVTYTIVGFPTLYNTTSELQIFVQPAPEQVVVSVPTFNPSTSNVIAGRKVEIVCPEDAAGVQYSYDQETWLDYDNTTVIEITETTTIYARAYDANNNMSDVVSATFTVVDAVDVVIEEADKITFLFNSEGNDWGFPTDKTVDEASFTYDDYTIKLQGTEGNGYKYDVGQKCLLFGKQGACLTLPAFSFPVIKIDVFGNEKASQSVTQNIFVGEDAVSTETEGAHETKSYEIASDYQAAGTIYTLKVTSAHNTQITQIIVYKGEESGTISTGINNVEQTIGDAAIYNLNGVRVNKVQKGVYVVNGKKVVIK